jgi:deazaflavin-dependent oxidoreductase (nitroreductase family)
MKKDWWKRTIMRLASLRPVSWVLSKILRPVDLWVLKISHGRSTLTQALTGLKTICVHTIGARTKIVRPVTLAAARVGENLLLAATDFGNRRHPDWYFNLKEFPEVDVNDRGIVRKYRARLVMGDERDLYWSKLVSSYQGFVKYQRRAGSREIPVFILEPLT